MRRLVQHALVGVGFSALTVSAAVAGLASPAAQDTVLAVPAAVSSTASSTAADPQPSATPLTDAERAARQAEETRSASRAQLSAAVDQATRRSAALAQQSRAISRQQARIKADRQAEVDAAKQRAAKASARAKAAAAAERKRADAERARAAAERERAAEAKAQAAAAAAAAKRAANEQGYEPGTSDPRRMAAQILQNKFDYGSDQFDCFNNIIIRESNWDIDATNASSGAYGIPQALPGSKMASVGSDWRTNPATQIIWAVGYMDDRYGSPCQAWTFKRAHGWY